MLSFANDAPASNSLLEARNGGEIISPVLTTMNAIDLIFDRTGTLNTTGLTNIDRASLLVSNGATLTLPAITTYTNNAVICCSDDSDSVLRAEGTGSVLSLPNLTSITGSNQAFIDVFIQAFDGGFVDLPAVTQIIGPIGGTVNRRGVQVMADGVGSVIDLSALTNFADDAPAPDSRLEARDGGEVIIPLLATLNAVELTVDATGTVNTTALTNIDASSFIVRDGGILSLPSVASYTHNATKCCTSELDSIFRAQGTGSVLALPNLTSITGSNQAFVDVIIEALEGGTVDLSAVTQITGPGGGTGNPRGTRILASGTDSLIDLSLLVSFTNSAPNPDSLLESLDGGTILAPVLTETDGVVVRLN